MHTELGIFNGVAGFLDFDIVDDSSLVFDEKFLQINEVVEYLGFGKTSELIGAAKGIF